MTKRKTQEQFIQDSTSTHSDRYDYSETKYINAHTKVNIICKNHGIFEQTPNSHLCGKGCPTCGTAISSLKRQKTLEQFIQESIDVHGNKYDYSQVEYINDNTKVNIICKNHGPFKQRPSDHLQDNGCLICSIVIRASKRRKTLEQFIQELIDIHGNRYNYSQVEYINNKTKIKIICEKHGEFWQRPSDHLYGNGCPICSNRISKPEKQWLESIGLPDDDKHRQVSLPMIDGLKKLVDGYNLETNTVYEFYGDYWHGNPNNKKLRETKINEICKKTFEQLYKETLAKEQLIKDSSYSLIVMWESDWNIFLSELKSARRNI